MTVVFICSSIEPGRDGVGDYTRRLAGELIRQGVPAGVIAIHDSYLQSTEEIGIQNDENTEINTLRISARLSWAKKMTIASNFIHTHDPDWLSLQYVPFGFQDKGLPFLLVNKLISLGKGRKWHVMFHELWVGMESSSSFKYKIWGYLQKKSIEYLLRGLLPTVIHTQCSLYKQQLIRLGYSANYLPLFGNIPVIDKASFLKSATKLIFVVFGTVHPNVPVELFTAKLSKFSKQNKKEVFIIFIGRNGPELTNWINALTNQAIKFSLLGEKPANEISRILSKANYGITSNPIMLVEKSGTTIAMIEHGLPVISVSKAWNIPFEVYYPTLLETVYPLDRDFELVKNEYKPITNTLWLTAKELALHFN